MSLAEFAVAVGATPKWVQNARALLHCAGPYTAAEALRLGLVREIHTSLQVSLKQANSMAGRALEIGGVGPAVAHSSPDGIVDVLIDVPRYLSNFAVRLSRARTEYEPRRRGRPPRRRTASAVERAREYGFDIGLLRDGLRLTPAERLRRLESDRSFVRRLAATRKP
jgi:enoyl-CoA hydratase/carnithine racemase